MKTNRTNRRRGGAVHLLGAGTVAALGAASLVTYHGWAQTASRVAKARVEQAQAQPEVLSRDVDLVICLDTSGSMTKLIDAARERIWTLVNDLALADPAPRLRVGILAFGSPSYPAEDGWVIVKTPLTQDLDLVSQHLFELTTQGGEEYVGRVVNTAVERLEWSSDPNALKVMVVAGNESADQDRVVDFRDACAKAILQNVLVNALYCGNGADDIAPLWQQVARLADGQYASIDHNKAPVAIVTPFDEELGKLSVDINATYIPIGGMGQERWANQRTQDGNALSISGSNAATRAVTKGGSQYVCGWDFVDANGLDREALDKIAVEDLPESMRPMTPDERFAHVEAMAAKRKEIQARITELGAQRRAFVEKERAALAEQGASTFDDALRAALRAQAEARGFRFGGGSTAASDAPSQQEEESAAGA